MKRRTFLQTVTAGAVAATWPFPAAAQPNGSMQRPNILWISCEDMSPDLGCYGDDYAITPNLDAFAEESVRYDNCFAHAPVCAPARSGIITGMYPTTIGTHLMRCSGVPPHYVKCFPEYLRAAGYFCTNNRKTDYQFDPPDTAWDYNSGRAHWRQREGDQPFFSVFNITTTHESQTRSNGDGVRIPLDELSDDERHDPADAPVPPFYPDTPNVRADIAQHYDSMTLMDKEVAGILQQLEDDGLAEDTIVIFWSDHGRGMPRYKRWPYDSGLHVALMARVPEKFRAMAQGGAPGTVSDELVSFIDFAPTVLSLAGLEPPEHFHGQAFLGPDKPEPRKYIYAHRDRMDEMYDMIRAVRDNRYLYIRNYMPHIPYAQKLHYMERMPTMQDWRRLHREGKLEGPQELFFQGTKPLEELYDCQNDPHNIRNLAGDPNYETVLKRLRAEHERWMVDTEDVGLIIEPELDALKWPYNKPKDTKPVRATVAKNGDGDMIVTLTCETPGASIAYKEHGADRAKLYTEPFGHPGDESIEAKAYRIGYASPSSTVIRPNGDVEVAMMQQPIHARNDDEEGAGADQDWPFWGDVVEQKNMLPQLRELRKLDYQGAAAMPQLIEALNHDLASVRYWAVTMVHHYGEAEDHLETIRPLLNDDSPAVKTAAAETLCDWGAADEGLPIYSEAIKHPQNSVRHYALWSFNRLGETGRPLLDDVKAMQDDQYDYAERMVRHIVNNLETT